MEYSETAVLRVAVSFALQAAQAEAKWGLAGAAIGEGKTGAKVLCCVKTVYATTGTAGRIGK